MQRGRETGLPVLCWHKYGLEDGENGKEAFSKVAGATEWAGTHCSAFLSGKTQFCSET